MIKYYLATLLLPFIFFTGCNVKGNAEQGHKKALSLPVIRLVKKDTVLHKAYVADIQALENVEIRAKIPGFIDKILVDEGQTVHKGQLLFSIENAEFETQLSKARAALSNTLAEARTAELEMKRVKILVDKNVIAKTEYELAEAKVHAAAARINEARSQEEDARIRLSYTYIRAPFDGVIDRIPFKAGSLVSEGNLLTTVSNLNAIYAYFNVSENEYLRYVKNKKPDAAMQEAALVLADGSPYPYPGHVETMENVFDENTGSIAFRARFPNPDKLLKHGATGKVKLTTKVSGVLMVPQKAVFEIQDKNYVFLLGKDHTVKMTNFIPQTRVNDLLIVQSGLTEGDSIVYEGIQQIRDGATIEPIAIKQDSLIAMKH
jgi:RND family efflux transporter MFP subunit